MALIKNIKFPENFNWKNLLKIAEADIIYSISKDDVIEKYGTEKFKILKFIGDKIYEDIDFRCEEMENKINLLKENVQKIKFGENNNLKDYPEFFDDIGGYEIWSQFKLYSSLPQII